MTAGSDAPQDGANRVPQDGADLFAAEDPEPPAGPGR
jgi:hypothetical protein